MISIRHSLSELERAHRLRESIVECYRAAVLSVAQYAIDLDEQLTPPHRQHLVALAESIRPELAEPEFEESRAALRNELRDYRDRGAKFLNDLREDLAAKAASLQRIFEVMTTSDDDHEARTIKTLACLREIAANPRAVAFRGPLLDAAESLEQSLEELKRQNKITVAQFLVEIQMLHNRIEALQTASAVDASTRLASRAELESHLAGAAALGQPFALLALKSRNLEALRRQFGETVMEGLLASFGKRLRSCLKPGDCAGRWGRDQFVVVVTDTPGNAHTLAARVAEHTSGIYVCMEDGKPVRPVLHIEAGVVDSGHLEPLDRLKQQIDELLRAA